MDGTENDNTQLTPLQEVESLFVETIEQARALPTKDDMRETRRQGARNRNVAIVISLVISVLGLLIGGLALNRAVRVETAIQLSDASIESLRKANQELEARGLPPIDVITPADSSPERVDVDEIVQAAAATLLARIRDDPAFRGPVGAVGPQGLPCRSTDPVCVGPPGEDGKDGKPGVDGIDGIDGTDGTDGIDGINGQPGMDGTNGTGDTGRGITSFGPEIDETNADTGCSFITRYTDGTSTIVPADEAFCAAIP